ncbi:MAG: amidohydrolase family protein, partial [Dehalococcoidia bacterium]
CHTHTNMPGDSRKGEEIDDDSDAARLSRARHNARIALGSGVTSLCDNGGWNRVSASLKREVQEGKANGPEVLVCRSPITKARGHCWFMGGEANGVDSVRETARRFLDEGADFLKVMATGGSTLGTNPFSPAYSTEELAVVVDEARQRGKFTAAHARCTQGIAMAVDAGFDIIAHCVFATPEGSYRFDQRVAERLVEKGVWVNPTLHIWRSQLLRLRAKAEREPLTKEEEAEVAQGERIHHERLDECNRLTQMGVKFVSGSDCGWGIYPFGFFAREIEALVEAGLSPMKAILSATGDAARALGISDRVGSLAPGKQADILVVQGDPVEDVGVLGRVVEVFKAGRPVLRPQPG